MPQMNSEVEITQLDKPRWERLARMVGTGIDGPKAYGELFDCQQRHRSRQYRRLVLKHPEILKRVEEIRDEVHKETVLRASMSRSDVQLAVLENIESAKRCGKAIVNNGEIIGFLPDHGAINTSLKLVADLNGLTSVMKAKQARGDEDPEALMSPDQLVGSILRKFAAAHGKGMDEATVAGLQRIADVAGTGSGPGSVQSEPVEVLPALPEATGVPSAGGEG